MSLFGAPLKENDLCVLTGSTPQTPSNSQTFEDVSCFLSCPQSDGDERQGETHPLCFFCGSSRFFSFSAIQRPTFCSSSAAQP